MRFHILTLFPELFTSVLASTMLRKGQERGALEFVLHNIRDFALDKHRVTDDEPYGGGHGMIMKPEPVVAALDSLGASPDRPWRVLLSPQGPVLTQARAAALAQRPEIALVCGRYEGVDERVRAFVDEELSVGDFILSGGEVAALVVIDVVSRLVPGVLGCENSAAVESFSDGLLEYPQYTRPPEFRGLRVPDVLLSGDHAAIAKWQRQEALRRTCERRPDLLSRAALSGTPNLSLVLLHHPVLDKNGQIVTTALTNMDIHDIARSARTYGVRRFYVATPVKALRVLAAKIIEHWETGYGSTYNTTRKDALSLVRLEHDLDSTILALERETGVRPRLVVTSARGGPDRTPFAGLRAQLATRSDPHLIVLGTGWGLAPEVTERADVTLEPICGPTDYNHLAVRSAAAVILDRLCGAR